MEQNSRYEEIDHYEQEFWEIIERSFKLKLGGISTSASSFINGPIEFIARFPDKNKSLKNTPYYFDKSQYLIHFTTLPKLFSIINDCSLRMYNLHNCNDPNEYSYAASLLKIIHQKQGFTDLWIDSKIEKEKEYSFITSCTSVENLEKEVFWQKYADEKKGIAIELEIVNQPENWEFFYISEVQYDKLNEFQALLTEWMKIQNKNKNILYKIDMDQILSLHKSLEWSDEKEIRLLTLWPDLHYIPFQELLFKDTKSTKPYNTKIQYFKLPLCDKNGLFINKLYNERIEFFWNIIPKIRISDIHFGPEFETDIDFDKFQIELRSFIYEKMKVWLPKFPKRRTNLLPN